MLWPEKNSHKEFDNWEKFPAAQKFPSPPPHNFSNGPSLRPLHQYGRGQGSNYGKPEAFFSQLHKLRILL